MDSFDIDSLDTFIKKYKHDIVIKLDSLHLSSKTISNQSDLVCMVLDYSPHLKDQPKSFKKYKIKTDTNHLPDIIMKSTSNRSLTLERAITEAENNSEASSNNSEILNPQEEIIDFIRDYVYAIIDNAYVVDRFSRNSTNNLLTNGKIRVYIFSTKNFIEVEITSDENFAMLKRTVLSKLENAVNLTIHYHTPEAYEFRYSENKIPIMSQPPILDTENIYDIGKDMVCFVEKQNYISLTSGVFDVKPKKLYGSIISSSEEESKINLKVYIKLDVNNISSTIIQMTTDNTLKMVLDKISMKQRLNYRNKELYFFVEHSESNDNEDMDNAINMDMELKYLSTYELDLYFKKFPDMPDYLLSYSQSYRINLNNGSNIRKSRISDDDKSVQEYVFNDVSAGVYQEFEVVKVKKYKNKVERVLGIDMYNLYNELPKNKKNTISGLLNFHNKIKRPLRKIKDIKDCNYITNKSFYIEFNVDGRVRQIMYEVANTNIRNEIVGKLKYLIVSIVIFI